MKMKTAITVLGSLLVYSLLPLPAGSQEKAAPGRWEIQKSGVEDALLAVTFVDEKLGFAVGSASTILKTTDGGKTWRRVVERNTSGPEFGAVLFTSPKLGWTMTTILGAILHTTDGGDTWQKVPLPGSSGLMGKQAAVGSTYFLQVSNMVYRTSNAGKTWQVLTDKFPASGQDPGTMSFTDADHGCAVWSAVHYAVTEDGGKTWRNGVVDKKGATGNYARTQFADAKTGWLLPHYGTIHATIDGGKTWQAQKLNTSGTLKDLHFADAKLGHVLNGDTSGAAVLRTTDGGTNWKSLVIVNKAPGYLEALCFPSSRHGWVVGHKGFIGHYYEPQEK
jgi:photosystem II stability/assembly factor-like uncharacterized protein